jgi:hypothetical protein
MCCWQHFDIPTSGIDPDYALLAEIKRIEARGVFLFYGIKVNFF